MCCRDILFDRDVELIRHGVNNAGIFGSKQLGAQRQNSLVPCHADRLKKWIVFRHTVKPLPREC